MGIDSTIRGFVMNIVMRLLSVAVIGLAMVTTPAAAQFSDSYKFLKAVRDQKGQEVTEMLGDKGSTLINTRDIKSGEAALHIVIKRRDATWVNFLLAKGAKADIRDNAGDTPLLMAARIGFVDAVPLLIGQRANVNEANGRGETALILAVQNRDLAMVRQLVALGADPALKDSVIGMSARDYAVRDSRSPAMIKVLDEAKPVVKKSVAGPKL
jgi:ankyrin repeat protein